MSDILVDFWDYGTGEPNLAPVSIIENRFTEEDGKTYTILDNCHNELHNKPKQDNTKIQEINHPTEHSGLYENNPKGMIGRLIDQIPISSQNNTVKQ